MSKANPTPNLIKYLLIGSSLVFLTLVLILPLIVIFIEAFRKGWQLYLAAFWDEDAKSAIKLTITTALIVLPINIFIGISIAWLVTKHSFKGKAIINTLLDLPFAVSPVIAGLMLVLLFGRHSAIGTWLTNYQLEIIFNTPGIILATLFVTFPFIARELIPLMQAQGSEDEQAALVLGARAWHIFFKVTLPNIKWALLYGIILANSRAIGEFGAVSVVSGHIRGKTNTMPLHVEILYNEYNFTAAFACASLLALIAIATIFIQNLFIKKRTISLKPTKSTNN